MSKNYDMNQINEEALKRNKLPDKDLERVTGGIDEIKVQVKTLPGDNDEYVIPLTS